MPALARAPEPKNAAERVVAVVDSRLAASDTTRARPRPSVTLYARARASVFDIFGCGGRPPTDTEIRSGPRRRFLPGRP